MTSKLADRMIVIGALGLFAVLLAWLAPSRLILTGDDFGYVDSVAATIRAGHWTPSDWVEPINLPLTAISTGLFAVTGNFYVSTLGLNLLLGLVSLVLLELNLRAVLADAAVRWPVVFAALLFPVWLHKTIEFTGVPLGLSALLAAWLCWRRGWLVAFFACVVLAALNRQSSLCLLAWPLVALARQGWPLRKPAAGLIAGGLLTAGVVGFVLLNAPPTWARELSRGSLLAQFSLVSFVANLVLAAVVLIGWRAACGLIQGGSAREILRRNRARPWPALAVTFAGAALVWSGRAGILWETPGFEPYSLSFLLLLTLLAWLHDWDQAPPAEVVAFLALYVLLVSWRGRWWDYYLLEPMLVLVLTAPRAAVARQATSHRAAAWIALALCLAVLPAFKGWLQTAETKTVVYERALRRGELRVNELSDAPFGYLGWKLFPLARQRPDATTLSDFLRFVEGARARYANGAFTVDRDGGRKSIHPSHERWALPADYVGRPLPLDNDEWRTYLQARSGP